VDTETQAPQQLQALNAANEVRMKRAEDKTKLRTGTLKPSRVIRRMPPHWESAKLYELLMPVPRVGRIKAQRMATTVGATLHTRLKDLTPAQRERIAKALEIGGWS